MPLFFIIHKVIHSGKVSLSADPSLSRAGPALWCQCKPQLPVLSLHYPSYCSPPEPMRSQTEQNREGGLNLQLPCCCCECWLQHCDLISDLWMLPLLRLRQYLYSPPALLLIHKWQEIGREGGLSSLGPSFPWIDCSRSVCWNIYVA